MGEGVVTSLFTNPDIDILLSKLLMNVQALLGKLLVGMYIHGSLAYGDFNPRTSDIDFLVITDGILPIGIFSTLKDMHTRLFASSLPWSRKLEGAYIPRDDLHHHDPAHAPVPWLGVNGHFALDRLGDDWVIQRWILREKGIIISGPALKAMIDPVSAEDLREAVRGSLREWWTSPFPSPERFESSEYRVYAVLTMCRSLYVPEHGCIASKPEAARWAMETLDEPWGELVTMAASWRPGMEFGKFIEMKDFIYYTLERFRS